MAGPGQPYRVVSDALADRALGQVQFDRGPAEAQVSRGCLKRIKR
jgi:hypothetical protein